MAVEIRFSESATADLEDLVSWYAERGLAEVGVRLVRELLERVDHLPEHPDVGRMVPEFGQPALREIIHPPFRVVYRRDHHVVRVWRGERLLRLSNE